MRTNQRVLAHPKSAFPKPQATSPRRSVPEHSSTRTAAPGFSAWGQRTVVLSMQDKSGKEIERVNLEPPIGGMLLSFLKRTGMTPSRFMSLAVAEKIEKESR